jgi:hypothetical protein
MLKEHTYGSRTHRDDQRDGSAARERLYRGIGRIFLLGAAFSGGLEVIFTAVLGSRMPVTLRAMLDLSPSEMTGYALAPIQIPIGLALDLPLWTVLLIAAAVPYAMAVHQSSKKTSTIKGGAEEFRPKSH